MQDDYDEADVGRMVQHLVGAIAADYKPADPINIVGIRTHGETLAGRLTDALRERGFTQIGRGVLDITLYRDDVSEIGPRPMVRPTNLDITIDGRPLLLVDDVLFTGRSVRAALDALSDFGRPSAIRLVVMVDRGGRELPIQPDYVGMKLEGIPASHRVTVRLRDVDPVDSVRVEPRK